MDCRSNEVDTLLRTLVCDLSYQLSYQRFLFAMRTLSALFTAFLLFASAHPSAAQPDTDRHLDLKVEPVSYILEGGGGHVGFQVGRWNYTLEGFGLNLPEGLHGNDGFEASMMGAEIHAEHFFGGGPGGFYAGPEAGVVQFDITHDASGITERRTRYSVGLRAGYRWYTGLGNLFISPVVGVSYTLNGDDVTIGRDTFESAPIGPWGTVGIGWSFPR